MGGNQIIGGYRYIQYEPVFSDCECTESFSVHDGLSEDCIQLDTVPKDNVTLFVFMAK